MISELLKVIGQTTVQYYLALRMNAGATTPGIFIADQLERPIPIVRSIPASLEGDWDRREILDMGKTTGILTRPFDQIESTRSSHFSKN